MIRKKERLSDSTKLLVSIAEGQLSSSVPLAGTIGKVLAVL